MFLNALQKPYAIQKMLFRTPQKTVYLLLFSLFILGIHSGWALISLGEVSNRLYDLEGQTVEIDIHGAYNPHQTSKEEYQFNIASGEQVAVVILPAEKGIQWFPKGRGSATAPRYIMVKVSHGPVRNEFGAVKEGPLLYWVDK